MSVKKTKEGLSVIDKAKVSSILPSVYGYRFVKLDISYDAFEHSLWIYTGTNTDYLVIPLYFCSCKDFIIRTVINKTSPYCKHVAGVQIAIKEEKYIVLRVNVEDAIQIITEVLDRGFSPTLRKLMSKERP